MGLTPDKSVLTGLAVGAAAFAIHQNLTPDLVDVRVSESDDPDVNAANKQATLLGSALVAGVALMTKDMTVLTIGGAIVLAMHWSYAHANAVEPRTGTVNPPRVSATDVPVLDAGDQDDNVVGLQV